MVFHVKQDGSTQAAMQLLADQVEAWGSPLKPEKIVLLRQYAQLLAGYNEANVIGTKELPEILLNHVLDSLSCLSLADLELQGSLVDVGSGGGLPGIPLAITRSVLAVTLLEATEKKVKFLRLARENLELPNLSIKSGRAEDAGIKGRGREKFQVAVTRALASLPVVVEYCAPLVQEGGWILSMKGLPEQDELHAGGKAAKKLGAELTEVTQISLLPELEQKQRQIVVFRKTGPTPTGYPRRVGLAKKRPLGS